MPALNFKRNFIPLVLDRSKPHTIRQERKYPIKVGDTLQLYYGLRTKSCVLIATAPCVEIQKINIYPENKVLLDESWLDGAEIDLLARRDGFKNTPAFFSFFDETYALPTDNMRLIWWNTSQLKINKSIYNVFPEVWRKEVQGSWEVENVAK